MQHKLLRKNPETTQAISEKHNDSYKTLQPVYRKKPSQTVENFPDVSCKIPKTVNFVGVKLRKISKLFISSFCP
jgi:hypothetical protein